MIGEDPRPGQKADKGSTVTLTRLAGARATTTIPSVVGLSEAAAKKQLKRKHLEVRVVTQTVDAIRRRAGDRDRPEGRADGRRPAPR